MGDVEDKEVTPTGDVFRRSTMVYSTRGKRTQCGHWQQSSYPSTTISSASSCLLSVTK